MTKYEEAYQDLKNICQKVSSKHIETENDLYRELNRIFKFKFIKKRLWSFKPQYVCSISCDFKYTSNISESTNNFEKMILTLSQITNKSQLKYTKMALHIEMLLYLLNVLKTNSFVTQYENLIKEVKENAN